MATPFEASRNKVLSLKDFENVHNFTIHLGFDPSNALKINQVQLTQNSTFFSDLLFRDGNVAELHFVDPDCFGIFLAFTIGHEFEDYKGFLNASFNEKKTHKKQLVDQWVQLVECYILGEFLGAPVFKDKVMDRLVGNMKTLFEVHDMMIGVNFEEIEFVYQHTKMGSLLKKLLMDTVLAQASKAWKPTSNPEQPLSKNFKLFLAEWEAERVRLNPWNNGCAYHEHPANKGGCPNSRPFFQQILDPSKVRPEFGNATKIMGVRGQVLFSNTKFSWQARLDSKNEAVKLARAAHRDEEELAAAEEDEIEGTKLGDMVTVGEGSEDKEENQSMDGSIDEEIY